MLDIEFGNNFHRHYILVKTKVDLNKPNMPIEKDIINTSSLNNIGIDRLLTHLSTYISKNMVANDQDSLVLITDRQRSLLADASLCLKDSIVQLDGGVETDIIASTLRGFIVSIKDVVGEIPNKDVLEHIFSSFCVGK